MTNTTLASGSLTNGSIFANSSISSNSANLIPSTITGTVGTVTTLSSLTNWNTAFTYNTSGSQPNTVFSSGLQVLENASFEKDITMKGISLSARLDAIEERLGILRPNIDLEEKWEKLKVLGEEYRKTEKEIIEGEQIWNTLSN